MSSASRGSIFIRGVSIQSQTTKTAYVENISFFHGICIKDSEISSLSDISSNCSGTSETWLPCPGSKGQYNCTINGTRWKIQGLNHSGIQQQNDTLPPIITSIVTTSSGTTSVTVTLSVITDENATCRFSTSNLTYENMTNTANTNSISHSNSITYTSDTFGTYFTRCNDTYGNVMNLSNFTNFNADVQDSSGGSSSSSGGGSGSGGGGGGGGSGGGLTFVCNMDWECGEWTDCINGLQTRQCDFVKVPQHAQETECPSSSSPLVSTQKCEAPKQLALVAETCNDNIKNQDEGGVDCGGACSPCKEKNLTAAASDSEKETNQLTGFSVKGIAGKGSIAAAFIVAIFVVFIAIKFYRRKQQ